MCVVEDLSVTLYLLRYEVSNPGSVPKMSVDRRRVTASSKNTSGEVWECIGGKTGVKHRGRKELANGDTRMSARRPPSACFVEREDLLKNLLLADNASSSEEKQGSFEPNKSTLSAALSKGSQRTGGSKQSQAHYQQQNQSRGGPIVSEQQLRQRQREEADKRAIEQALQAKKAADDKALGKLSSRVKASMAFLDGVDRELNLVSESRQIKARRAFEEWNSNVHGKIQQKISESVNNTSSKDLHEKNLSAYQTFLDITNRKPVSLCN